MELLVGEDAHVAGLALPDDRGLVARVPGEVPVEAVVGEVRRAVGEPLRVRRVRPVEALGRLLEPVQLVRQLEPERCRGPRCSGGTSPRTPRANRSSRPSRTAPAGRIPATRATRSRSTPGSSFPPLGSGSVPREGARAQHHPEGRAAAWKIPPSSDKVRSMDRDALEALRGKYVEMLRLRDLDAQGDPGDPRPAMRALAAQFPGALREIDELPRATILERIAAIDRALASGRVEPWMIALSRYHASLRVALRIRLAITERTIAAARALGDPAVDALDDASLAAIVRPPAGRLNRVVLAMVAREIRLDARADRVAALAARPRGPSRDCIWAGAGDVEAAAPRPPVARRWSIPGRPIACCAHHAGTSARSRGEVAAERPPWSAGPSGTQLDVRGARCARTPHSVSSSAPWRPAA